MEYPKCTRVTIRIPKLHHSVLQGINENSVWFLVARWDGHAEVWYAETSNISGLVLENPSLNGLREDFRTILPEACLEPDESVPS